MKYQSTYVRDIALRARADEGYVKLYNEPEEVWESAMK